MESNRLVEHTKKANESISILFRANHTEAALILLYSWIDRMAWLSTEEPQTSGAHFKTWIDTYFLPEYPLGCSSSDLWSARCALLHTGSAESNHVSRGNAKRLLYYGGDDKVVVSNQSDTVFVKIKDLHVGFLGAIINFEKFLNSNKKASEIANKKLGKILSRFDDV